MQFINIFVVCFLAISAVHGTKKSTKNNYDLGSGPYSRLVRRGLNDALDTSQAQRLERVLDDLVSYWESFLLFSARGNEFLLHAVAPFQ